MKLELAGAARDAGAHAELEVRGPTGAWRADVLATDPAGGWAMALEAQLAPITDTDITARTETMRADGVSEVWFSDRPRPPWLGAVPSVRLERPEGERHLAVELTLASYAGQVTQQPVYISSADIAVAAADGQRIVSGSSRLTEAVRAPLGG